MQITRRLMLASAAALALAPGGARAAPAFALDIIRNRFSLKLPDAQDGVRTVLAARPGGALLVHSAEGPLYGRAFGLEGDPAGGRFKLVADNGGTFASGVIPDPVVFDDGSALVLFSGTVKGVADYGVFARPLASDGRKGDFVRIGKSPERPATVAAARFGADAAIVAWGQESNSLSVNPQLRWRIVAADGAPRGEVHKLEAPFGAVSQYPRVVAGLTGGGAAIGFVRSSDVDGGDSLWMQRVSPEGEAAGDPVSLGSEAPLALAGLGRDRVAVCIARSDGDLDLTVFSPEGRARLSVVRTGLTSIRGVIAARPISPDGAGKGLAILVAGFKLRGMGVFVLLVDDNGAPLAKPAQIYLAPDGPAVFGMRSEAHNLVVLENGDLLAVYRLKDSGFDTKPQVASLIRIGAA